MHLENSIITGIKIAWNQWLWYNWVVKKQLQTGGSCNTPDFAKDTVYRFMKMVQINWMRFTTILASRIINNAILPLDSEDRANVLIIDDSMFERNRSTMPCLHFWKLLKKLQFQQNMFFLTAGFHLQFSRCIGTYSSAISLRKWFDQSVNSCYGFIVNFM